MLSIFRDVSIESGVCRKLKVVFVIIVLSFKLIQSTLQFPFY